MSSDRMEVAAAVIDDSIDAQAVAASRAYPFLRILCLRCGASLQGDVFESHLQDHRDGQKPVPAHWEAL